METKADIRVGGIMVAALIWAGLLVAGFLTLMHEAYAATPVTQSLPIFPIGSALALDPVRPTLLLFVHPKCPCTKATFHELDALRVQARDRLAMTIVFTVPAIAPPGFQQGDLWTAANKMKGIRVMTDLGGVEARRFDVRGSGHVLVYSPAGRLLFSGGITASRGQEGDSRGLSAIVRLARGIIPPTTVREPVYGCALL